MAQFGGNKNQPPWLGGGGGNPHGHGRPEHMQPGLMGFGGPHGGPPNNHGGPPGQGIHQAGPPVFAAQPGHHPGLHGPPGLSLVHGPHTPATVAALAGQQGVTYRGASIPPFAPGAGGAGTPAQQAQQILQQQAVAAVAAVGLQQHHQQQQQHQAQTTSGASGTGSGPTQRVFTGTVTKFHENFGFVDEDVFFQTSVVKGQTPRVNDRVLVEAGFNANMPFKWNATRIQVLPTNNQQQRNVGGSQGGPNTSSNNSGHGPTSDASSSQGTRSVNPSATPNAQAFSNTGSNTQGGGGPPPAPKIHSRDGGYGNHSHRDHDRGGSSSGSRAGLGLGAPSRGGSSSNIQKSNNMSGDNSRNDRERRGGATRDDGSRGGGGSGQRGATNYSSSGAGNRDRERERDRDRDRTASKDKDDNRKRSRSPLTGSGLQNSSSGGIKRSRSPIKDKVDRDSRSRDSTSKTREESRDARGGKSRSRSRSPPRRRPRRDDRDDRDRPGGSRHRYSVSVPKIPLHFINSNVMELKKRYSNMYIPSDFFTANHSWNVSFPTHQPLKLMQCKNLTGETSGSLFHIFGRDSGVELPISDPDAIFDPNDADHIYSAKVMLMALPQPDELLQKTCQLGESSYHNRDSLIHPTRAIQFLVGVRGKNETMAIGGPWSPTLDGPNPGSDPSVLVRTAIRTCKALAGIDLSNCTKWHRFLEIHYRRQETSSKPQRTETTIVFLPDVWSVMPNIEEYGKITKLYEEALQTKLAPPKKEIASPKKDKNTAAKKDVMQEDSKESSTQIAESDSNKLDHDSTQDKSEEKADGETENQETAKEQTNSKDGENNDSKSENTENENATNEEEDDAQVNEEKEEDSTEPTSWRLLDIKSMKVNELRTELDARGMNSKGLKAQLVSRLQEAVEKEELEEMSKANDDKKEPEDAEVPENKNEEEVKSKQKVEETETKEKSDSPAVSKTEDPEVMEVDRKVNPTEKTSTNDDDVFVKPPAMDEKQKLALTAAYKLPDTPCILVHPHPKAKSGKFDCTTMSLSVLLDYRTEDNKEGTFEVSLFAELFNEMMMRDSGYQIYRAICDPERAWKPAITSKEPSKESKDNPTETGSDKTTNSKDGEVKEVTTASSGSSEGSEKTKHDPKKDKKIKMVTRDKNLLMACSYFDLNHSGYIETKDAEDILLALNLNLSRAQVKKLVSKVQQKDQFNYRHFTDRPEDEDPKPVEIKSSEEEEKIGKGFKAFLPSNDEKSSDTKNSTSSTQDGFCTHNGVVVDVGKLLNQLERSEQARFDAESRLSATNKILSNIRDAEGKQSALKEKLQHEAKDLKKKLRSVEDNMKTVESENHRYLSILKEVHTKITPTISSQVQSDLNSSSAASDNKTKVEKQEIKQEDTSSLNGKLTTSE